MLKLLAELFSRQSPREPPSAFGTYYVSAYQEQLDRLARELSNDRTVRTRFNRDRQCVELYVTTGEILARVRVEGEGSTPATALIATSLSDDACGLFSAIFEPLDVRFVGLPA